MSKDAGRFVVICADENNIPYVETIRTSRQAAEEDIRILKDIYGRKAWIDESENSSNGNR